MKEEIDHNYTEEIVCPYCGCEFGDSWENSEDSGEEECYECGKEFEYYRHIEVTYCTYQITEKMKEQKRIRNEQHRQRIKELLNSEHGNKN
jgi:DNA-directed RNA polymerase subunit RPC12/RpoP